MCSFSALLFLALRFVVFWIVDNLECKIWLVGLFIVEVLELIRSSVKIGLQELFR